MPKMPGDRVQAGRLTAVFMNVEAFMRLLEALPEAAWQSVIDGQSIVNVDDQSLTTGAADAGNAIIRASGEDTETRGSLKQSSLDQAADILHNYYLTHPVTLKGFNAQVQGLIDIHGAEAFASQAGGLPKYTLFVEGGEVVAEPQSSPRHRYGVFCELDLAASKLTVSDHVRRWLERGEAHERYLEMNVCRYNC
jgi:hypothetical protein